MNIFFGILVYFILVSASGNYISTKIDTVVPNYAAEEAGIEAGDELIAINNKKVRLKSDIDNAIQNSKGNEINLLIERNGKRIEIVLIPTEEEIKNIGIYLGASEDNLTSEIKGIYANSVAQNIGLKEGDIITKIDGIECTNDPYKVVELITSSKNEKIQIEVKRNKEIKTFEVVPQIQKNYKIGVTFALATNSFTNNIYYGFWDTIDFSTSIIDNLKRLFTGNVSVDQLTRTSWDIGSCIKNKGNCRICILGFINIIITRCNKPFTISTTRWGKNSNTFNRSYKKETIKRRNRSKNTTGRILLANWIINICNI